MTKQVKKKQGTKTGKASNKKIVDIILVAVVIIIAVVYGISRFSPEMFQKLIGKEATKATVAEVETKTKTEVKAEVPVETKTEAPPTTQTATAGQPQKQPLRIKASLTSTSEGMYQSLKKGAEELEQRLAEKGLDARITINLSTDGGGDKQSEWDLAFDYAMPSLNQTRQREDVKIVAWKENCAINSQVLVTKNSSIRSVAELKGKKVVLFNKNDLKLSLYSSPERLNFTSAELYKSDKKESILNALKDGKVDAIVVKFVETDMVDGRGVKDSDLTGKSDPESIGLKVLATTDDNIPCRFLLVTTDSDPDKITHFFQLVGLEKAGDRALWTDSILAGYTRIDKPTFDTFLKKIDWNLYDKRDRELKPLDSLWGVKE